MKYPRQNYLYVATDGKAMKIGITVNPNGRRHGLGAGVRYIKIWARPYAREIETLIKAVFSDRIARGSEWFLVSEKEILFHVNRAIRISDDGAAISLGIEPSKRPGPGEPPHEPPFELQWLKAA